jgi:hypothetical protein
MQTWGVSYPKPNHTADEADPIDTLAKAASEADAAANADGHGAALYDFLTIVAPAPVRDALDHRDPGPT